ncbi:MAG: lysine--tRNA ligase [Acidobacteria bacterium]|nr:lysine--tRNA ligase [Acidobacteriota bacterium]
MNTEVQQEGEIFTQRREKLEQIRALGFDPYPHKYAFTHTLTRTVEQFSSRTAQELEAQPIPLRVCGRILTIRRHGKASFLDLYDGNRKLQIYVKKDVVGDRLWSLFELLDNGDVLGVEGALFRTKMGELTVRTDVLTLLAKALLPWPFGKFQKKKEGEGPEEVWYSSLADVEARYRQRYLDLVVNRDSREVFLLRSKVVRQIRRFLDEREYIEVETPMMQARAGGALARPFVTHHNALDMDLYLRIAPELYLKRLVVGGLERVYEINRNFRNEGISTQHNPEFTMLEFYQAYSDYRDLMELTESLLTEVADQVLGKREVQFNGHRISFDHWQRFSLVEAIGKFWGGPAPAPTPADLGTREGVGSALERAQVPYDHAASRGELLGKLFESVVERQLIQPTFIYDYPVELSPLSKTRDEDPAFVERFELYIGGLEIANAYSELNDPEEQRERFEQQAAARARGDEEAHVMDENYVTALRYGMPPAAGEGIGIDRLTMVLTDRHSIRDVIFFPHLRPE